ncbi:SCO family protein [Alcaligenes ammonioxydans]|uniref:SCO family protein n=1 Tax=Alcaligenes ammonioxydans TaxID=2582914 RepID=UPI001F069166|nr:SCO family protein [Alcaligenes ammonioxydans]MCH1878367.1 SCO family protein [Alcaligenes ammonioxydans]
MRPSPVNPILVLFKQYGLTLALSLLLLGSATAANLHPVRGFLPDLRFSLQAAGPKTLTHDDFKDKVVMMFFGYASCPDICPTTLAQLGAVMDALGDKAEQVRILFVSVDPHRDTPDALARYVAAFDGKHTTGLTGSEKQIADLARRYRVAYQIEKPDPKAPENYEVSHSRGVYIFDQQGRARYLAPDTESVQVLAESVRSLLP